MITKIEIFDQQYTHFGGFGKNVVNFSVAGIVVKKRSRKIEYAGRRTAREETWSQMIWSMMPFSETLRHTSKKMEKLILNIMTRFGREFRRKWR